MVRYLLHEVPAQIVAVLQGFGGAVLGMLVFLAVLAWLGR
jgi:hypothetical protein